jgi:hypothetical protein
VKLQIRPPRVTGKSETQKACYAAHNDTGMQAKRRINVIFPRKAAGHALFQIVINFDRPTAHS